MQHSLSLNTQLKEIIDNYLTVHTSLTVNGLANRANVPGTSLRRMIKGSNKSIPAAHTVLNLVSYIYREKNIGKLLTKINGPVGAMLSESFGSFTTRNDHYSNDLELNETLSDQFNYFIYKLAANHKGTTESEVYELYGSVGITRLKSLVAQGDILNNEKGQYHAREKNFALDLAVAKKHLPELVNFYRPEEVSQGRNLFYSLSESLNNAGIQKVKDIQRDAVKKIGEIVNGAENHGDIPYFSIQLCETLLPQNQQERNLQ